MRVRVEVFALACVYARKCDSIALNVSVVFDIYYFQGDTRSRLSISYPRSRSENVRVKMHARLVAHTVPTISVVRSRHTHVRICVSLHARYTISHCAS